MPPQAEYSVREKTGPVPSSWGQASAGHSWQPASVSPAQSFE